MNATKIETDWTNRTRNAIKELRKLALQSSDAGAMGNLRVTGDAISATSWHLLAKVAIDAHASDDGEILVPPSAANELGKITAKSLGVEANAKLTLTLSDGRAEIRNDGAVVDVVNWEPVSGKFPNLTLVLPKEINAPRAVADTSFEPKLLAEATGLAAKFGDNERSRMRFIGSGEARLLVESDGVRVVLMPKRSR